MHVPQHKSNRRYGFNMTPMIDVVFLLIIFFLVSSHLAKQETQMELELPTATSGDEDIEQDIPRVTINVQADGTLWLTGRLIKRDQVIQKIQSIASKHPKGKLEVRIRGSKSAPYSSVEPIMLACTKAGVWNVVYAVYEKGQ